MKKGCFRRFFFFRELSQVKQFLTLILLSIQNLHLHSITFIIFQHFNALHRPWMTHYNPRKSRKRRLGRAMKSPS